VGLKTFIANDNDWERFQQMYPQQASRMLRDYISDMVNYGIKGEDYEYEELLAKEHDLEDQLKYVGLELQKMRTQRKALQQVIEEKKILIEQQEKQQLAKQRQLRKTILNKGGIN
jgi:hypothetical protein